MSITSQALYVCTKCGYQEAEQDTEQDNDDGSCPQCGKNAWSVMALYRCEACGESSTRPTFPKGHHCAT